MTIWGAVVGGTAGFALGGPIGALLGGLAGHAVDRMRESVRAQIEGEPADKGFFEAGPQADPNTKKIAFTIGVIVLGAKMAKADGRVTPDEVQAFKQVFHVPPEEMKNVGRIFDQAKRDSSGFEPYARQIARLFRDNPMVLEELLDGLFHIAKADGVVKDAELDYLGRVAEIFGLDEAAWSRIRASNLGVDERDPYSVLGLTPDVNDEALKQAYRRLVRENHPDMLVAQGMPQEFVEIANQKLAAINAAYETIRKQRGLT